MFVLLFLLFFEKDHFNIINKHNNMDRASKTICFMLILSTYFHFVCCQNHMLQTQDIELIRKPATLELFQHNRQKIELLNLPDVRQAFSYTCGPSSIQAVLMYYGLEKREDILAELAQATEEKGSTPQNLLKAVFMFGLTGEIRERLQIKDLQLYIDKKIPVIVAIQAYRDEESTPWQDCWDDGHYVVAIGYDQDNLYFEDPSLLGSIGYIPKEEFISRWHDIDANYRKYFRLGIIIYGNRRDLFPVLRIT